MDCDAEVNRSIGMLCARNRVLTEAGARNG
jgi:hypothetical protein